MSTIQNIKEMERLATSLMNTAETPQTKFYIGMLLQLFGKEAENFGKLNQALSNELAVSLDARHDRCQYDARLD